MPTTITSAIARIDKAIGNYNPKFPMGAGYYAEMQLALTELRASVPADHKPPEIHRAYIQIQQAAHNRSLRADYKGCSVHICCNIALVDGWPTITGFALSDWHDTSTVATYVDGVQM